MACLRDHFHDGVVLDGRYRTITPLNHGSFGMVFLAKHIESGESVAIKCLTKKGAADEAGLDFAIDDKSEELLLHRHLGRHPNIVNLTDSFETDSHVYLVLELCERGDLYEAIRMGQGPLETEHVRQFMLELVDAVQFIHDKGVYHRDIKPENIFLTQTGSLKLGDFGLATTDKWTYETTVGSDRYMSPEQFDSAGAGYSPAQADIWAIGICLLNILFSRNPFTTPTEADPLFLDFSRDKQSLFDVFPSMSQDTYEVIVECMNMDPKKRSLEGARNALLRLVSFTTEDEALDEFCSVDHRTVASAHREPLRTPSIQSPMVECASTFPWTKALNANVQPLRQLSAIADDESYTEELFSKSEATTVDWCSAIAAETPSSLGASMNSLAISQPMFTNQLPLPKKSAASASKVSPMAGSLPITMSRSRHIPSMSLIFGRKDGVSKSWSDMWDEDEEEEEQLRQLADRKKLNARTWSQDSTRVPDVQEIPAIKSIVDDEDTPRQGLSPATKSLDLGVSPYGQEPLIVDNDFAGDTLFFSDPLVEDKAGHIDDDPVDLFGYFSTQNTPAKSPSSVDKWAALGERRRAYTGSSSSESIESKSPMPRLKLRTGDLAQAANSSGHAYNANAPFGHSGWDHDAASPRQKSRNNNTSPQSNVFPTGHSGQTKWIASKDRTKERPWNSPWNKGRSWNWGWRRDKHADPSAAGWVGNW